MSEHPSSEPAAVVQARGTASRWAPADHADVTFTIARRARSSAAAIEAASTAYGLLDRELDDAGPVVVRRTTVALSVRPVTRWDPSSNREIDEGFEATRSETVRFAPPVDAGAALRAITTAVPDLGLIGPAYGLDPENPVHAAVRADAAAAARRSAEAYASGLGLVVDRVRALTEPGLRARSFGADGGGPMVQMAMAKTRDAADGGGPILVELTNQDVEVTAAIDVEVTVTDQVGTP